MIINLHIASEWVGINLKSYSNIFPRPLDYGFIAETLKNQRFSKRAKAVCIVYSRRAAVRIAPIFNHEIKNEWIYEHFPYGERFNTSTHIFGYEVINSTVAFMAALPADVVDDVCNLCENIHIKKTNIKQIDVIERCLFIRYMGSLSTRWVCFPLNDGLRILSLSGGLPSHSYLISNDPAYRNNELSRLTLPEEAVVFEGCDWLKAFLHAVNVKIIKEGKVYEAL